jgi:multidrug efflux pump subunit AcrA (membrane-fusion protein)
MKPWVPAIVAVGVAALLLTAGKASPAALPAPPNTVKVKLGKLADVVSLDGTLTYRAPYSVINRAAGIYTQLPAAGHKVGCGEVLYRVNEHPVLLLCGRVPAYRALHMGDKGKDVRQLNRNLRVSGDAFTAKTENALAALQRSRGIHVSGSLPLGAAVFLPTPVRVAKVTGELGGSAPPGAPVARATSDTLDVQVELDASQQGEVKPGDRALITLPGNRTVTGAVRRLGRVAQAPAGRNASAADATIPASIGLDKPRQARGLDRAPVQVDITTKGVARALSVPVTALVGRSGGGFAVEVVRAGGRRELVAVKLGLFDDTDGRVAVGGDLRPGDSVVVPSL